MTQPLSLTGVLPLVVELRVEPARETDAAEILAVHVAARTSYYRGFQAEKDTARQNARDPELYASIIREPGRVVRVARLGPEVAGFLMIGACHYPEPGVTSELQQIQVHPDHFRRGIGTALHAEAVSVWEAGGVAMARLWVWDFNTRARAFYAAHGWTPDGRHPPEGPRIGEHRMLGYLLDLAANVDEGKSTRRC